MPVDVYYTYPDYQPHTISPKCVRARADEEIALEYLPSNDPDQPLGRPKAVHYQIPAAQPC